MQKGVAISHCRQLKRTVVNPENVRTSIPLPIWVVTIDKTKDNITKLHEIRGIHHFLIKIQDFTSTNKSMQCFRCQNFGHKAEFCNMKDRCVKCDGQHNTRACAKAIGAPPNAQTAVESTRLTTGAAPLQRNMRKRGQLSELPPDHRHPGSTPSGSSLHYQGDHRLKHPTPQQPQPQLQRPWGT